MIVTTMMLPSRSAITRLRTSRQAGSPGRNCPGPVVLGVGPFGGLCALLATASRLLERDGSGAWYTIDDILKAARLPDSARDPDGAAKARELKARGVDITQEPNEHEYGTDFGLRDPFGNHIRIVQLAPTAVQAGPKEKGR